MRSTTRVVGMRDPEIRAMGKIARAVARLEADAARRVIAWAVRRYEERAAAVARVMQEHQDQDVSARLADLEARLRACRTEVRRLRQREASAWGIIAAAGTSIGAWDTLPEEWREAAAQWRDGLRFQPEDQTSQPKKEGS